MARNQNTSVKIPKGHRLKSASQTVSGRGTAGRKLAVNQSMTMPKSMKGTSTQSARIKKA